MAGGRRNVTVLSETTVPESSFVSFCDRSNNDPDIGPVKPLPVTVNTPDGSIGSGNIGLSSTLTAASSASGSASTVATNSAANEDFIVVIIGEWLRRCYRWRFPVCPRHRRPTRSRGDPRAPVRARQDGNTRRRGGCRTRSNLERSSIVSASCWTLKGPSDGQEAFSSQETGSRQAAALREIDSDPEGRRHGTRHAGAGAGAGQGAGTPRERRQACPRASVAGNGRSGAAQARKETGTGTPQAHQGVQGDARHP